MGPKRVFNDPDATICARMARSLAEATVLDDFLQRALEGSQLVIADHSRAAAPAPAAGLTTKSTSAT